MIYLFEDSPTSSLSMLYKAGFTEEAVKHIKFVSSCGEVFKMAKRYIRDIDVVPDNPNTVAGLKNLMQLQTNFINRLTVIPIVCSEYYLLKSAEGTSLVANDRLLKFCLYGECHLLDTEWRNSKSGSQTYEQYCKHTLRHSLIDCIGKRNSQRKEVYTSGDCFCKNPISQDICVPLSLSDKAIRYIMEYPMFPKGSLVTNSLDVTDKVYRNYVIRFTHLHNNRVKTYLRYFPSMYSSLKYSLIPTDEGGFPYYAKDTV